MSGAGQYRYLFSPLRIGPLTVRNRIVFSAHLTNYAEDGLPTAAARRLLRGPGGRRRRADHHRGALHPPHRLAVREADPRLPPRGHPRLPADHRGRPRARRADPGPDQPQRRPGLGHVLPAAGVGARARCPTRCSARCPRPSSEHEIAEIVAGYALVAGHCAAGGFDGVELQCSHSSIVRGFLSPATNRRTDGYGGSLANRARLLLEIVAAVREAIGPDLRARRADLRRRAHRGRHHDRRGRRGGPDGRRPPVRSTTSTPRSAWPPPRCT